MPQFDLSTFQPQIIWLIITFSILYWVMARKALPKIAQVLEERECRISDDIESARQMRDESEAVMDAYEQSISAARQSATAKLRESRAALRTQIDALNAEANDAVLSKLSEADARIGSAKAKAMQEIQSIAVDACGAAVARLLGESADANEVSAAVSSRITAAD